MSDFFAMDTFSETFFRQAHVLPPPPQRQMKRLPTIDLIPINSPVLTSPWLSTFGIVAQQKLSAPEPLPSTEEDSDNLRSYLKMVREPKNSAFDLLPNGQSIGAFANKHAVTRYARTIESKREQARASRQQGRKRDINQELGA